MCFMWERHVFSSNQTQYFVHMYSAQGLGVGSFQDSGEGLIKKGRYTTCSHPAGGGEISKQAYLPGPGVTSVRKDMTDHILYMTPH